MSTGQRYWQGVSFESQSTPPDSAYPHYMTNQHRGWDVAPTDTPEHKMGDLVMVLDSVPAGGMDFTTMLRSLEQKMITAIMQQQEHLVSAAYTDTPPAENVPFPHSLVVEDEDHTVNPSTTTHYLPDGGAIFWTHPTGDGTTAYGDDPEANMWAARSSRLRKLGITPDENYAFTGLPLQDTTRPVPPAVVSQVLTGTRDRLTPPSAWGHGVWAGTTASDSPYPWSDTDRTIGGDWDAARYRRWCLVGAIRAEVNGWHRTHPGATHTPWDTLAGTIQHLHRHLPLPSGGFAANWNDGHTHAEVLLLLTTAIQNLPDPRPVLPWTTWPLVQPGPRLGWSHQDSGVPPFDQIVVPAPRIPDGDDPWRAQQTADSPPSPSGDELVRAAYERAVDRAHPDTARGLPEAEPPPPEAEPVERILRRSHATPLPGFEDS